MSSCFFYLIPIFFDKCICPHKNIFRTSQGSLKKSIFTVFGMLFLKKMHFAIVICKEKGKTFLLSVKNTLMFWMNDVQLYLFATNYLCSFCTSIFTCISSCIEISYLILHAHTVYYDLFSSLFLFLCLCSLVMKEDFWIAVPILIVSHSCSFSTM